MPPIFGGAGHHNHVGFVQPAHLYDEDFDEIGSDRDELEDLDDYSAPGEGRSATRSRLVLSFSPPKLPFLDREYLIIWVTRYSRYGPGFPHMNVRQGMVR